MRISAYKENFIILLVLIFEISALNFTMADTGKREMTKKKSYEGTIKKEQTVGYRSPYYLYMEKNIKLHLRTEDTKLLGKYIDKKVNILGEYITIESIQAEEGSEAASQFMDGTIPKIVYLKVESIGPSESFFKSTKFLIIALFVIGIIIFALIRLSKSIDFNLG